MATVQENIKAKKEALDRVLAHPLAAKVSEDGGRLLVLFPPGYQLDGVRVSLANGYPWACRRALAVMDRTWPGAGL